MDVQKLIGEVARRHNVLIDSSDPIFLTVTLNELLVDEYVKAVREAIASGERAVEKASRRHVEEVKRATAGIVSGVVIQASESVRIAGSKLREQLESVLSVSLEASIVAAKAAQRDRRASERAAAVSLASVCVMAVIAGAMLLRRG
jgi:predicted DNA-binding protein (UPF0278 family)